MNAPCNTCIWPFIVLNLEHSAAFCQQPYSNLVHLGDSVFLVIHANPAAIRLGLVLRDIRVFDKNGQYVTAKHSHMSSVIPGFDASLCHDLNKETYCSTRIGDQDPCIELEYPIDRGFSRIEIDNYKKQNDGATIIIYGDHFWINLLWKSTFQDAKDLHVWRGKTTCYINVTVTCYKPEKSPIFEFSNFHYVYKRTCVHTAWYSAAKASQMHIVCFAWIAWLDFPC